MPNYRSFRDYKDMHGVIPKVGDKIFQSPSNSYSPTIYIVQGIDKQNGGDLEHLIAIDEKDINLPLKDVYKRRLSISEFKRVIILNQTTEQLFKR